EFMVAYMRGFVEALTSTFGMGTNGYLMVVIFAYIGGVIAEQTRRELLSRSGSGASLGGNLVPPLLGPRPDGDAAEDADDEDEGEEIVAPRTHRVSHGHTEERREHRHPAHHRESDDDEEAEPQEPPARPTRTRSQAEERAIQRFVERALKNYDHSKL